MDRQRHNAEDTRGIFAGALGEYRSSKWRVAGDECFVNSGHETDHCFLFLKIWVAIPSNRLRWLQSLILSIPDRQSLEHRSIGRQYPLAC